MTDNEPTMNAFADLISFPWCGCFDHLIQLVPDVVFKFDTNGTLKAARAVVGYFNYSSQANDKLLQMQDESGSPLTVIQDVPTRWWSTYAMCERLIKLKLYSQNIRLEGRKISEKEFNFNLCWQLL